MKGGSAMVWTTASLPLFKNGVQQSERDTAGLLTDDERGIFAYKRTADYSAYVWLKTHRGTGLRWWFCSSDGTF